jgi:type II secretory pathway pseudopilin PulG
MTIRKGGGRKNCQLRIRNRAATKIFSVLHSTFHIRSSDSKSKIQNPKSQRGMSLIAVMAVMTLFAIALLAVAPTVQQGVQREKELESIRRGEEIAEAIKKYVEFYQGRKLPDSIDELLEGLPQGTKKRQILRPSAAVDPLSEDGKWRLIKPDSQAFINFGKRVQIYNGGALPSSGSQFLENFATRLTSIINTESDEELKEADDEEIDVASDKTPFIGVASQSRSTSVIAYYGIENHSKWVFTPLFRGSGFTAVRGNNGSPNSVNNRSNERETTR